MIPTEAQEQIAFVNWLELMGLMFTAIPNSTYTTSWKQKNHNRNTGLRAGFPDLIVLVPRSRSSDGLAHLLAIEMKRVKNSRVSPEQQEWIDALNQLGTQSVKAHVCKGAEQAIAAVSQYLPVKQPVSPF